MVRHTWTRGAKRLGSSDPALKLRLHPDDLGALALVLAVVARQELFIREPRPMTSERTDALELAPHLLVVCVDELKVPAQLIPLLDERPIRARAGLELAL